MVAMLTVAWLLRQLDLLKWGCWASRSRCRCLAHHRAPDRGVPVDARHPRNWLVRWYNLETYFWPVLFDGTTRSSAYGIVRPRARERGVRLRLDRERCHVAALGRRHLPRRSLRLLRVDHVEDHAASAGAVVGQLRRRCRLRRRGRGRGAHDLRPHITYRGFADALYTVLALALVQRSQTASPTVAAEFEQEARS
jgi:hypothetical protein